MRQTTSCIHIFSVPSDQQEEETLEGFKDDIVIFGTDVGLHTAAGKGHLVQAVKNELGCSFRLIVSKVGWDGNYTYEVISDKTYAAKEVAAICKRQMERTEQQMQQ